MGVVKTMPMVFYGKFKWYSTAFSTEINPSNNYVDGKMISEKPDEEEYLESVDKDLSKFREYIKTHDQDLAPLKLIMQESLSSVDSSSSKLFEQHAP
ncbi:hypothetical protein HHI36_023676 [Cryptolaemus montrouzieri]|uniref:Uncharacterized protein n=1 Tax=Cryptolaemus montrouzieri TaxID=559131 RepID=A0ABD2PHB1_9CUCU